MLRSAARQLRHHAAGFHGSGDQPLADDALLHDHVGLGERLLRVAAFLVKRERDVVGPLRMHGGRARRERFLRIGHRGLRLVVDFDQLSAVARDVAVGGDHHGHRMPDEVDAVDRQDVMVRHAQSRQRGATRHGTGILRSLPMKTAATPFKAAF